MKELILVASTAGIVYLLMKPKAQAPAQSLTRISGIALSTDFEPPAPTSKPYGETTKVEEALETKSTVPGLQSFFKQKNSL